MDGPTHIRVFAGHWVVVSDRDGKMSLEPGCDEWQMTWDKWPELRPLLRLRHPSPPSPHDWWLRDQARKIGRSPEGVPLWTYDHEMIGDVRFVDDIGFPAIACALDDEGEPVIAGWSLGYV